MSEENQQLFSKFEKLYWGLSREMSMIWKDIFESHLPGSQSHILLLLERNGSKKMSELAEALYLTPGAITTSSDKLIKNGYINRVRDENDRRVVYLEITEKGSAFITELQKDGRDVMKVVFSHVSETDLAFLIDTFEQATGNIDQMRKDTDL